MPGNNLNIIIGGSIAPSLAASATQAATAIEGVAAAATQSASAFDRTAPSAARAGQNFAQVSKEAAASSAAIRTIPPAAGPAGAGLGSVATAATKAGTALKSVGPGANQAGLALTNIGRVAQDLPFGFIGIQNNLNPLLESFQRLRAETGSNGAALKALGSSLIGAGGIGLALSLVSSAIVIFQNGIAGFNKKTKEAKEASDDLAKSIRSISAIEGEATASVQGQIALVNSLAKAASDANKPYGERKRALEELKEINKAYFGDLTLEDTATAKLTKSIQEYNAALINSAIQKQFIDDIAKLAKDISESDEKVRKGREARIRSSRELAEAERNAAANSGVDARTGELTKAASIASETRRKAVEKEADAIKALSVINETDTKLKEQQILLTNKLNAATQEGLKFKNLQGGVDTKEIDLLKQRIDALKALQEQTGLTRGQRIELAQLEIQLAQRDGIKLGFTKEEVTQQIDGILEKFFPVKTFEFKIDALRIKPQTVSLSTNINVAGAIIPNGIADGAFDGVVKQIRQSAINSQERIRQTIAESIQNSILQGIEQGVSSLSESFGSIFSGIFSGEGIGAALAQAGQGFLGVIGSVLQDIGKQVVATSVLVQVLKKALASLFVNPAAALGVGVGLIALGGFLKNIKFNVPKFAEGGIATGPTLGLFGEAGREAIIPLDRLPDLVGQMNGNTPSIALLPSIRFAGADFQIMLNRVDDRRAQLG